MRHVTSTVALKPSGFDLEVNVTSSHNPYEMNEEMYKALLVNHKRRRMEADVCFSFCLKSMCLLFLHIKRNY